MLSPKDIDDFGRQKLKEMLATGKPFCIVAGSVDYFGNSVPHLCESCGKAVVVSPWLHDAIVQHGLKVKCKECIPEPVLKGQIAMDLEKMMEKVKGH